MIYVIVGPTGSGKTFVANKLSQSFNAPIINADAFQIYKDMDIGTAKLSKEDPNYSSYHLLDIVTPDQSFSVKEYQTLFRATLDKLLSSNKNIIVVGGTGLYIRAALYDYNFEESSDDVSDLEALSNEELYSMLISLDPQSAKEIHQNNRKRVIRAISIARTSSMSRSENISSQKHELIYKDVVFYMLDPDRETLYENINARVDEMMKAGLVDETRKLLSKYSLSTTSKQAIGYKEVIELLNGEITEDRCVELIKQRSRNYAKRQWTFFNHQLPVIKFKSIDDLLKEAIK